MASNERSFADQTSGWQGLSPDWAAERLEELALRLEEWGDVIQARRDRLRVDGRKRLEQAGERAQQALHKLPGFERAEELRKDVGQRVERNVDSSLERLLTRLELTRQDDLERVERELTRLGHRLSQLEQRQKSA